MRIHLSRHRHLEIVIVPMAIGIVAQPVDGAIPFVVEQGIVKTVSRAEVYATGNACDRHPGSCSVPGPKPGSKKWGDPEGSPHAVR